MSNYEKIVDALTILLEVITLILIISFVSASHECANMFYDRECWIEIKACLVYKDGRMVEVVSHVWINGGFDYANRPFKFRCGEKVSFTAPSSLYGFRFGFWQREEGPTFQGLIVTNRTLTVIADSPKQVWWMNFVEE